MYARRSSRLFRLRKRCALLAFILTRYALKYLYFCICRRTVRFLLSSPSRAKRTNADSAAKLFCAERFSPFSLPAPLSFPSFPLSKVLKKCGERQGGQPNRAVLTGKAQAFPVASKLLGGLRLLRSRFARPRAAAYVDRSIFIVALSRHLRPAPLARRFGVGWGSSVCLRLRH